MNAVASWRFNAETDKGEGEHRVDLLAGRYYCTCADSLYRKRDCKHIKEAMKGMESSNEMMREVAVAERNLPSLARQNPAALAVRLQDMKENRRLTREFFASVMEEGVDYGVIPGTEKPSLWKPGAESLCELYGYAATYSISETKDLETGFLRVVATCTLVQRGTGEVVTQGIGECNTREARYFYRWMPEWELSKHPELVAVKDSLKKEVRSWRASPKRKAGSATFYRVENDDLFTLWNTVTKMAKKRSHIDATLGATRSSGIFSQGQSALEDWIEGEFEEVAESSPEQPASPSRPASSGSADTTATPEQKNQLIQLAKQINALGPTDAKVVWGEMHNRWPACFPSLDSPGATNRYNAITSSDADACIAYVLSVLNGEVEDAGDREPLEEAEQAPLMQ